MTKPKTPKTFDETRFKQLQDAKTFPNLPGRPAELQEDKQIVIKTNRGLENKTRKTGRERSHALQDREIAKKEISDLTRLLDLLPENQLSQIFTDDRVYPLFEAIFGLHPEDPADPFHLNENWTKWRKRLLSLTGHLIELLEGFPLQKGSTWTLAEVIAPNINNILVQEGGALPGIRALWYQWQSVPE